MRPISLTALAIAAISAVTLVAAEPQHGLSMYGEPALPPDFVALPYANPEAPRGGRIVQGEVGSFDSLNPHIVKGRVPWQLRFLANESLMGRSYDEPFTLYGLLAESVEVPDDRSWVEFTLRPEARFSDGTPVTVEDVLWTYATLGTEGHPRYHGSWKKVDTATKTGERTVRFTFNTRDDELPLILGLRPILKREQWEGVDFKESGVDVIPISSAPYVISDFEAGRFVTLSRNPDYWGDGVVPYMNGMANLDEIRMEFFTDATAMFEAFKAGILTTNRETNAQKWDTAYDFPSVEAGDVVKSIIPHKRPSGLWGLVMNTRLPKFQDWRVREALITAFNFEFINETVNGGEGLPRAASYFSNSVLGYEPGPASGKVADLLEPFADALAPGALDGYELPNGDGTERNRRNIRADLALMEEAGWTLQDGVLKNSDGETFTLEILLAAGSSEWGQIADIYSSALERIGIEVTARSVDSAEYKELTTTFDFEMTDYGRGASLSPGNEQTLYWSSEAADTEGSRNLMGMKSPAAEAMIEALLTSESQDDFLAAARALDRVLSSGRYVVPIWYNPVSRIAHAKELKYPEHLPMYGDWIGFQPDVWWYEEE